MNNEPVAWMHKTYFPNGLYEEDLVWSKVDESSIPLYTHPAKTLTDEEIIETVKDHFIGAIKLGIVLTNDNVLDFARAILKKAQEK
jgi:hypothetical protein